MRKLEEKFRENTTLKYYNENATSFSATTRIVDFSTTQDKFLALLQPNAYILDFGCGSGRDTKYFMEHGYRVEATDGSEELCKLASTYTGVSVKYMLFQELDEQKKYNGIWACSSILHLPKDELKNVMQRMLCALKDDGVIYTSFKYGTFEGERNGRYFTDFTEKTFDGFLSGIRHVKIEEQWLTGDVRPGRESEQWLNFILMAERQNKVKKYRKPLNLNIGMLIFGAIFIYVIICVIMYFQTDHIVRYEVTEGSLATNNIYKGIAIRKEEVVSTDTAGYVNFYAREGERVAKGDTVYIVDETGRLSQELEDASLGENTLSNQELSEFRNEIVNFMHGYDDVTYESTYDFKYSLKNTVLKLANVNMLQSIKNENGGSTANIVNFCYAPTTGIVAYWTDGYEGLTVEGVTEAVFDHKDYEKKQMLGNELMAVGDPVYKLSTDENWSVVIPIDAERGAQIQQEDYVKVRFLKNQYESWGQAKLFTGSDGNTFLSLTFTNSMVTFISDRFLDIELILNDETGLKIPNSSIVEKEFFLIDEDFVSTDENTGTQGVIRQCYLENGNISSEFVETDAYSYDETEGVYYMDTSVLKTGDVLYKTDSQDTYTVSKRATLIGVYNVNKGYADFKQINILYQNDEYSIVRANTTYGLNVYDYIVLDGSAVSDDQIITNIKKTGTNKDTTVSGDDMAPENSPVPEG